MSWYRPLLLTVLVSVRSVPLSYRSNWRNKGDYKITLSHSFLKKFIDGKRVLGVKLRGLQSVPVPDDKSPYKSSNFSI